MSNYKMYNPERARQQRAKIFIENNSLPFEEWRVIKNTNNKYFISSVGRLLSLAQNETRLKCQEIDKDGYSRVKLSINGQKPNRHYSIHKLMAEAFELEKPEGEVIVHHKDFTKRNVISNLEYLTIEEHNRIHREREEQIKADNLQKREDKQE